MSEKHEGEKCDRCGKGYSTVYQVSDQVWQNLHMMSPAGFLCPECCDKVATNLGSVLYWEAEPGQFPTEKAKAEIERLWERMRWLGEVGRPAHPDDERPWIPAYLDARKALKKAGVEAELLRIEIEAIGSQLLDVQRDCVQAKYRTGELEEELAIEKGWVEMYRKAYSEKAGTPGNAELLRIEIERASAALLDAQQDCEKAKARTREAVAETIEEAKRLAYDVMGNSLSLAEAYCDRLDKSIKKITRGEKSK